MQGMKVLLSLRVRMIGLLFVLSFINYLLRNNLSAATDAIGTEYSLNATQIGWLIWSFNFTYALFQIPGGMLADAFGSRLALTLCAASWGLLTCLTGLGPELLAASAGGAIASLMAARLLLGAAQAPLFPICGRMIAVWFPAGRWALPNSVLNTALTLGQAAIGPVFGYLITEYGWRNAFYMTSPTALVAAGLWWLYARDSPREHPAISADELHFIEKTGIVDTRPSQKRALRQVMFDRNVLLLAAGYFCSNYVFYIFANWLMLYLVKQRGYSLLESGLLSSLPFISGGILATVGGMFCDRLCRSRGATIGCRVPGMLGLILVACFLLGGVYSNSPYLALTLLSLCFGFQQFTEGAFWAGTTFAAGPHAGTATGVLNTGGNLPGLMAPAVGLLIDKSGWASAFASGAIFAIAGAVIWLFVRLPQGPALAQPSAAAHS